MKQPDGPIEHPGYSADVLKKLDLDSLAMYWQISQIETYANLRQAEGSAENGRLYRIARFIGQGFVNNPLAFGVGLRRPYNPEQ
jgi:hypothetical protein